MRIRGAFEAASWVAPNRQTIIFWRSSPDGSHWRRVGRSSYPNVAYPTCHPQIQAAALKRASHAVYVLDGCFTGDGVVNSEAFASGRHGWGVLEPAGQRHLDSRGRGGTERHPVYSAMYRWMRFRHHQLETVSGNYYFFSDAEDARYPLIRRWVWSRHGFRRVYDSQFTAAGVGPPHSGAPPIPAGACPRSGTFAASFGARLNEDAPYHSNVPLRVLAFSVARTYPKRPRCVSTVAASTPMTAYAVHVPHGRYELKRGPVTHARWITAPAWLLVKDDGYGGAEIELWPHYTVEAGVSPYVVPKSLKVNEIRAELGRPEPYSRRYGWRPDHRPATGTVTFRHGRVVALSVAR